MPYIKQDRRLDLWRDQYLVGTPRDAGELNYAITAMALSSRERCTPPGELQGDMYDLVSNHLMDKRMSDAGLRYADINEAIGALTCAGMEWRRRIGNNRDMRAGVFDRVAQRIYDDVAVPYERNKIQVNGDIEGYAKV